MSKIAAAFIHRAKSRLQAANSEVSYGDWITQNTMLRGRPFSMGKYPFQKAIADDMHPNMSVIKCSQVGLTEVQLRKILAFVKRNRGVNAIYTLPDEKMFKKVSQGRVKPCIEENKVFHPEDGEKPVRSMSTMQFNSSFLYMVNATEGAATSQPADLIVNDEVDLSDAAVLALFNSRLQNSEFKIKHKFSTPTFFGYGIDAEYEVTDQREFVLRCPYCGHDNIPDFSLNHIVIPGLGDLSDIADITEHMMPKLDLDNAYVMCERCHKGPLDLDDPSRRWVSRRPDIKHARGYRVRPLSTARIGIRYIVEQLLEYRRKDYVRGWYNTVVGVPYVDGNIRLERPDIEACIVRKTQRPDLDTSQSYVMGIDMGANCHLTLGTGTPDATKVVLFEVVNSKDIVGRVAALCEQVNVIGGSVDRHPYTPTANDIMEVSKGKVIPVEYRGSQEINVIEDDFDKPTHAQADRTSMLDYLAKMIRSKKISFELPDPQVEDLVTHLRDMVRDERPDTPARWVKLTGNDHYFHSLAFMSFGWRYAQYLRENTNGNTKKETRSHYQLMATDYVPNNLGLLVPAQYGGYGGIL